VYDLALALLKESSEKLENTNPTVLYHLGMTYYKRDDVNLARETLKKFIALNRKPSEVDSAKRALAELGEKR
jgi:uncharacterized protein HemY